MFSVVSKTDCQYFRFGERSVFPFCGTVFPNFYVCYVHEWLTVSSGFFTSIGKSKLGIVVSLTRQIIFLLPLILIFPLFMGIDGVMYADRLRTAAAALVAIIFAEREMKALQQGNVVLE